MTFVPVPNTVLVEVLYILDGQNIENTLYFEKATEPGIADMEALAESLDDWAASSLMPNLSANLGYRGLRLTNLTTSTSPVVELPRSPVVPGTDNTASIPNSSTFCIQFKTNFRGRSFRGRNYIPGLTVGIMNGIDSVDVAWVDDIITEYNMLMDSEIVGAEWIWVVVSRVSGGVDRVTGLTTPVIAVTYADLVVDNQRRRLPGRGS